MERAMKKRKYVTAMAKKITWFQQEIMGISDGTCAWRNVYEESGFRGVDRRRGKLRRSGCPWRCWSACWSSIGEVFRFNLRHFHEKLASEHQIGLSYSWVKACCRAPDW